MKNDIEKLKEFIKNNPPLDENGKPQWWNTRTWTEQLDKLLPNWRDFLKKPKIWKEIKGIKPRKNYEDLLKVILKYAPDRILVEYLNSSDGEERRSAYNVLIEDDGGRLTSNLWKLLDENTKSWLISKIVDEVKDRHHRRFLEELEILLHDPEYFLERIRHKRYFPWVYSYMIPLAIAEIALYEKMDILHPLWLKLKATVEQANDLFSMKKLEEYEQKFKEKFQRIIEKLNPLWQLVIHREYPFVSKNVMLDPSLLFDYEKAKKAFSFMRVYSKEFNFFISHSFYDFLKEYRESNKWYVIAEFFGSEKEISPGKLLELIDEHRKYFTFFETPKEPYKEKYSDFYENLHKEVEDKELVEMLFEEWIFLQEFSWIVAKTKRTFEKFKEAGAAVLEVSKKALDKFINKIARHKLNKKDDEILSTIEKFRGLGKWIAHGGITAAGATLPSPIAGALITYLLSEGFFVLIDPEEILEVLSDGDGV